MAIFDISKDELLRLSDVQLEELIARLAEAEIAAQGHSPAYVSWSGSINAPDGGVDIRVQVPTDHLSSGFIERADTIFQAKKHSMTAGKIKDEMRAKNKLHPTISDQASKKGSYIIVSLDDDCSPPMKKVRLEAMHEAVNNDPNSNDLHLDFYDRSKLAQWVRQHPSILLWVKDKLGQGYSGWQAYGAWSRPPQDDIDKLIILPGVSILLPSKSGQKFIIKDAIDPMRDLIRSTNKAVRITGLSGVGKTRIVQALFDEDVGTNALDRTIAVYVDTGEEPNPSATAMLDSLIDENRRAVMVLDNCPSELHSRLAGKVASLDSEVKLITVEYDIQDDKPQTTEVIHIEADGPEVSEKLLMRRFPHIGQINARRIAEFSDGNARVSLAIAERVGEGESLASLSDSQLFKRLFQQAKGTDESLIEQAEVLALVYSFSLSTPENGDSELDILASLSDCSPRQLYRSVSKLMDRHVVQKRAHWRAILPHAIANRLAKSALDAIPADQIRATFEAPGRERLLMSFAHRLGLLHDHPVAIEIVEAWLQPDGLFSQLLTLDNLQSRILQYVAPVAPEILLDRIEAELTLNNFAGMDTPHNKLRTTILNLLQSLAYESNTFDRCINLMICVADHEAPDNNYDPVRAKIQRFFQPYLSGTHASLEQRIAIMKECFDSDMAERRALGFDMLSTALGGPSWSGSGLSEFGARPRDFGFHPNYEELAKWRRAFIELAVEIGVSGDPDLENAARQTLATRFGILWKQAVIRETLVEAARKLHTHAPWIEGWKAIRSTIYFNHTRRKGKDDFELLPANLAALDKDLEPQGLIPNIMTYVLTQDRNVFSLGTETGNPDSWDKPQEYLQDKALQLGNDFATSGIHLDELGFNIFSTGYIPHRTDFGRGLAKGSHDLKLTWRQLVDYLNLQPEAQMNYDIFAGFIEEVDVIDPALAQELLDQCCHHTKLKRVLVGLHPWSKFTEADLNRCMALLDDPEISPCIYDPILCRDTYASLPTYRVLNLAQKLLSKPSGDDVILHALCMKLSGKDEAQDVLGADWRKIGLQAAIQRLSRGHDNIGQMTKHYLESVVKSALCFEENDAEKCEWLDAIFMFIDRNYGHIHEFRDAIVTTASMLPEKFLDYLFDGTENRRFFISTDYDEQSLLSKINIDVLISWCREKSDTSIWRTIALGIELWSQEGNETSLTKSAIQFLEAAPEPADILNVFSNRVSPSSWSGSRASIMQDRADAISALTLHSCTGIANSAKLVLKNIEEEKEREQLRNEEREQRFE
ncbi:hypothetical protein [Oceanospirillum linum]|uniref:Uncharacterized protein n=1 Tax=Oceanospirillum linum TaxID=966 RepID=A0A1T1HAA6_OCELI|nr:hypothetical protein [Oceanospirillum linum]OOV86706.1 hypothetical protein BTA35_0212615 [Oceanospirillum linum]SEG25619.1 hypothetical protein SAMN04489856_10723 [Oleiphilus messinensis]SMP27914.1 hypothetical protein SAMN06264348_106193 [Oceanospirillum linum]